MDNSLHIGRENKLIFRNVFELFEKLGKHSKVNGH